MTKLSPLLPTTIGTVGVLQRQVRNLLNSWTVQDESSQDARPVGFFLADSNTGVLPPELDCRVWMLLEEDESEDPLLVLPAIAGKVAVYVVATLTERATIAALASAMHNRRIEIVTASPGGMASHWLQFSPSEASYFDGLLAEYLDWCPAYDPDWLAAFRATAPRLPTLCQHLNPALLQCERSSVLVLQGSYGNHLRAVGAAVGRCVGG